MKVQVYIAASFEQIEAVRELQTQVKALGCSITADWTTHKEIVSLKSPKEREALKRQYAVEDTAGVQTATVYALLLGERKSTGAHIELGIALGAQVPHICLIGHPDKTQLFYSHPSIKIFPDASAFLKFLTNL